MFKAIQIRSRKQLGSCLYNWRNLFDWEQRYMHNRIQRHQSSFDPYSGQFVDVQGLKVVEIDFEDDFLQKPVNVKAPSQLTKAFLDKAKSLQLEEIVFSESFAQKTDQFFATMGHDHIFSIESSILQDKAIRRTIDRIVMQLYEARATVGGYISRYANVDGPLDFSKQFEEFARKLITKILGKSPDQANENKLLRTVMKFFLKETEDELEYIESQIYQVDCALLFPNEEEEKDYWHGPNDPKNLFAYFCKDLSPLPKQRRKKMLQFLKRLVFKVAVCCERVEFFVKKNGSIRARNATLDVLDASITDTVSDDVNMFDKDKLHKVEYGISGLLDLEQRDILRTFCLQHIIFHEIQRLNRDNVSKRILADKLKAGLEQQFKASNLAGTEAIAFPNLLQATRSDVTQKIEAEIDKWENNSAGLDRRQISYLAARYQDKDTPYSNAMVKRLICLLASHEQTTEDNFKQLYKAFFHILITLQKRDVVQQSLGHFEVGDQGLTQRNQLLELRTYFGNIIRNIGTLNMDSAVSTLHILPSLLHIVVMCNKELRKIWAQEAENMNGRGAFIPHVEHDERNLVNELIQTVKRFVFNKNQEKTARFFLEQIFFSVLPPVFETFVDEYQPFDQSETDRERLYELIEEVWKEPQFSTKDDPAFPTVDFEFQSLASKNYQLIVNWQEIQNLYVVRVVAMARILQGRAISRLEAFVQNNIVNQFCSYVSGEVQDLRRRQLRGNLLFKVIQTTDTTVYAILFSFLFAFLKWESTFHRLQIGNTSADSASALAAQSIGKSYLTQDIDQYVRMAFQMKKQGIDQNSLPTEIKLPLLEQNQIEANFVIIFRLLDSFNRTNMKELFEKRSATPLKAGDEKKLTTRKNLEEMLKTIFGALYDNDIEFSHPFEDYGKQTQFILFSNFCSELCCLLLIRQHNNETQVKEFRNLFVMTWFIMLANFYNQKEVELNSLKEQYVKDQLSDFDRSDIETKYRQGTGKLFRNMLNFCKEAKGFGKNMILVPDKDLVKQLRRQYMPKLISCVGTEARFGIYTTLDDVLQFLLLYAAITIGVQRRNPDDPRLMNMMPILLKIAQTLLKESSEYQEFARDPKNLLSSNSQAESLLVKKMGESATKIFEQLEKHEMGSNSLTRMESLKRKNQLFALSIEISTDFRELERRLLLNNLSTSPQQKKNFYSVYCSYMLFEAKKRMDVFESIQEQLQEKDQLIKQLQALQNNVMALEGDAGGDRTFKDTYEMTFLRAELTFLNYETSVHILETIQKKDPFILSNQVLPKKILTDFNDVVDGLQRTGFTMEALQFKICHLERIVSHSKVFFDSGLIEVAEESKQCAEIVQKIGTLVDETQKTNESDPRLQQFNQPKFAAYHHVEFFGKQFPPELSDWREGFVVRTRTQVNQDFRIVKFIKGLFADIQNIQWTKRTFVGQKPPQHEDAKRDQEVPLLVITEVKPLSEEQYQRFKNWRKANVKDAIKMTEYANANNRANFSTFREQNFKKYFTTESIEGNEDFTTRCLKKIENELNIIRGPSNADRLTSEQCDAFCREFFRLGNNGVNEDNEKFIAKVKSNPKVDEVLRLAQERFSSFKPFKDNVMRIVEVPNAFPTGFFFQPVRKKTIWKNSGAMDANLEVQKHANDLSRYLTKEGDLKGEEPRELESNLRKILIADVGGGVPSYIPLFFAKNGYHSLNESNPQYHAVLRLFNSLDHLLQVIKDCIALLRKQNSHQVNRESLDLFDTILDDLVGKLDRVREEMRIDDHMADKRDQIDSEGEDEDLLDNSDSDD